MQDAPAKKCPSAAPAWVMTFADLMSLLLAFFVLLFSFSELDKSKYKQIAGSMREAFGVQREVRVKEPPKGINFVAREFSPAVSRPTPLNVVRQDTRFEQKYLRIPEEVRERLKRMDNAEEEAKKKAKAIADKMKKDIAQLQQGLKPEIDKGLIEIEREGQKIIVRIRERGSFDSGSAAVYDAFRPVLNKMGTALNSTTGRIVVAGHTDNVPIATERYRSNWELSSSRAVTVVHELVRLSGISPARFEIAGYGETRPLDTNDTAPGRARNRRVEVVVIYGDDKESGPMSVTASEPSGEVPAATPGGPTPKPDRQEERDET